MDADKWRKLSLIYHAVLSCPAEERSALLDSTCGGDPALRAEIESLIGQGTVPTANFSAPSTIGNYRIERLLGVGGIGFVFLAYDPVLHRRIALKVIHGIEDAEASRVRLLREARSAAALNHPNICVIHEVGDAQGTPFIAMEYVEGPSLRERIDAGKLPIDFGIPGVRSPASSGIREGSTGVEPLHAVVKMQMPIAEATRRGGTAGGVITYVTIWAYAPLVAASRSLSGRAR
jgi:hypothetical protein